MQAEYHGIHTFKDAQDTCYMNGRYHRRVGDDDIPYDQ